MASRPRGFGLTSEIKSKIDKKYSVELEQDARLWIEAVIQEPLVEGADSSTPLGMDNFQKALKDGVALCKLFNQVCPEKRIKKIQQGKTPFVMMENISNFLAGAESIGVSKVDLFQTADLYDKVNMAQVLNGIYAVGRKAQTIGYDGPSLGVKESNPNRRDFTEEQLNAGQCVIGLQMGSNKGASQAGMNFGKTRQIRD